MVGPASQFPCEGCGEPAHHWAYDHTDPDPLWHQGRWEKPVPYSRDERRYQPLCRGCHLKRDRWASA
jgi:hypothetical protein